MAEKRQSHDFRKLVKWFWLLVLSIPVGIFLLFFVTSLGLFGPLPSIEDIANPPTKLASQIISSDGVEIGKFFLENRTNVQFDELSPDLVNALVATEDERFYSHAGIDFKGLARAIYGLGKKGGASTITQQLAKMQFTGRSGNVFKTIIRKLKENIIAVQIERHYTKEEIIAAYFNQMDFIYKGVGIESAAQIYFSTTPDSLHIEEAAVLVGMCKNPDLYNPKKRPENAKQRRNVVFGQMVKNDYLSAEEADSLKQLPLEIDYSPQGHDQGMAPYFREYLRGYMKQWLADYEEKTGTELNLYTDGLKIYTTIDSRMQRYAEEAMVEHMSNLQRVFFKQQKNRKYAPFYFKSGAEQAINSLMTRAMKRTPRYRKLKNEGKSEEEILEVFNTPVEMTVFSWQGDKDTVMSPMDSIRYFKHFYQVGLMSVEPQTGFVKAWVGGIDFRYFKYDHVKQGRRQVGSTFKPFVYATAITQKKYSPCMEVPNVPTCIEKGMFDLMQDWCPENSDRKYGGMLTLKKGLATSTNTVTAYLMKQIGPGPVIELARKMGVQSEIPVQPSIALGSVDLSVYEMVGTYTTFANKGIYTEPIMVTRIEDKKGVELDEFTPRTQEVMGEKEAYVIVDLLKGVTEGGTGTRLKIKSTGYQYSDNVVTGFPYGFSNPIAGKTGTTQNNSDGWFMGMVPNLITGVWTGCEDRSAHFGATYYGQGATTALPIWALFMEKCYADQKLGVSKAPFEKPESDLGIELDCTKYNQSNTSVNLPEDEF
jgi:penicillin-binding protein 1A